MLVRIVIVLAGVAFVAVGLQQTRVLKLSWDDVPTVRWSVGLLAASRLLGGICAVAGAIAAQWHLVALAGVVIAAGSTVSWLGGRRLKRAEAR